MKKTYFHRKALRSAGAFLLQLSAFVGKGKLFRRAQVDADRRLALGLERWIESGGFLKNRSMEEVAEELGVEVRQLSYYSSRILGEPFMQWRKRLRLVEAREIIRDEPGISSALVGRMVGIPDKSNFRKLFKECFGMTPTEWGRACRDEK